MYNRKPRFFVSKKGKQLHHINFMLHKQAKSPIRIFLASWKYKKVTLNHHIIPIPYYFLGIAPQNSILIGMKIIVLYKKCKIVNFLYRNTLYPFKIKIGVVVTVEITVIILCHSIICGCLLTYEQTLHNLYSLSIPLLHLIYNYIPKTNVKSYLASLPFFPKRKFRHCLNY